MNDIFLLRRDECQPLTNEQMNEIKSQFRPADTANVNITPYYIYDEDEHVVGEWRETIDGVKKKKPVYEKTLVFTYTGNNVPCDFSDTERIIDYNFLAQDSDSRTLGWHNNTWGSYANGACAVAYTGSTGNYWTIWFSDNSYWSNAKMSITWKYTKISDEWEEV